MSDRVLRAISFPTIDHRGPEFDRLGRQVIEGLQRIFKMNGTVVVYPSSGTGAWEASLVNTLSPGDRILMFETGHFAILWKTMALRFGLMVDFVPGDWRHGVDPVVVEAKLAEDRGAPSDVESRPPWRPSEGRLTYHDPCHLRKAQGITDQPRCLLKSLPGVTYQEVSNPDRCCGFGGTFSLSFQSLSDEIGGAKVDALMRTGAETVVTACPGCMLHLANGLHRRESTSRVVHLAEVLVRSYREDARTQ